MTPTPGVVPDLFPGAPQREAGLDLHAIAGRLSTTPWLRSYPDVPPRARSAPRGAMTLALAPTLARHAEHASTAVLFVPRNYRPLIASLVPFTLRSRQPTPSRSRRTSTRPEELAPMVPTSTRSAATHSPGAWSRPPSPVDVTQASRRSRSRTRGDGRRDVAIP